MAEKFHGSVKWFSNKKGFGFITPAEGSPSSEDIFVHQSSIHCEGYRTLLEGWEVEFEIGHDDDGKVKAVNVTAPGGGPCTGIRKNRRYRDNKDRRGGQDHRGDFKNRGPPKPSEPFWHESLSDTVKNSLKEKDIRMTTGTMDVAVGNARVKLGTKAYAAMAHPDAIIAEGTFQFDPDGLTSFTWQRCISFDAASGQWISTEDKAAELLSSFSLSDANVHAIGLDETAKTLWGDGPSDPKDAFEEHGFLMRRVVLVSRRKR